MLQVLNAIPVQKVDSASCELLARTESGEKAGQGTNVLSDVS